MIKLRKFMCCCVVFIALCMPATTRAGGWEYGGAPGVMSYAPLILPLIPLMWGWVGHHKHYHGGGYGWHGGWGGGRHGSFYGGHPGGFGRGPCHRC